MSNVTCLVLAWLAVAVHLFVGGWSIKRGSARPLVTSLNLLLALCVIGYWVREWYSYIFRGILWYATDQLVPLYAIIAALLSIASLTGRYDGNWPHWIVFTVDLAVCIAAALYFSFFKINRLF